ncbi:MAG TPA: BPSL0067 family protein [Thermoanaerobaculia bacterium]|nr:BPSL0067 family protein [Thermoanaerobaculia bacterium]
MGSDELDTGHCARLVQIATGAPKASFWRRGEKVRGNSIIAYGTAIATFELGGLFDELTICGPVLYTNRTDHTAHAALYVSQDENGIKMIDQWQGRGTVGYTTRDFLPHKFPIESGDNDYVIEGPPYLNVAVLPDRSQPR